MGLRIISVVGLLILGASLGSAGFLPQLPVNRLSEGPDRDLLNSVPIDCGHPKPLAKLKVKSSKLPSQVLSYFDTYPFSSSPIGAPKSPTPDTEDRFKFAVLKPSSYFYALHVDAAGEKAYWLPQGGVIEVPRTPNADEGHYVFTPDFSGCSWTVTPMDNGYLRLRHVEGGKEDVQFNSKNEEEKGGPVTYAMEYKDYGHIVETRQLTSNVPAYAYMHYSGGQWTLYVQTLACAPSPAGSTFQDNVLLGMTLVESQSNYKTVNKVQAFKIPVNI